ncbi:MAG: DUF4177 domain-containing protein [Ruminiclostridium sp.]|nr:DUF4177 domain-containing protein [Ruminiclostridium sp.]
MEKWEYTTIQLAKGFMGSSLVTDDIDGELNLYGEQGWELVNCFSAGLVRGIREVFAVFKRRKWEEDLD